ncbi:hypothetical protein AFLA_003198 [Aspergillus flavus NRRL3357]|nr:hypothetical protein AFLA_003198 [Aspergillus flavus NRRL3357]
MGSGLKDTPSSSKGETDDMDIFVLQGTQIFLCICVNFPAASEIPGTFMRLGAVENTDHAACRINRA